MRLLFILFITLSIALLLGCHLFVYSSIIKFFVITKPILKKSFFVLFLFLTFSFVLSSILINLHFNIFSKAFYFLSSLWMGWLLYLIIGFLFVWLVAWLSGYFKLNVNFSWLTIIIIIFSLFYSLWGVYNAHQIKIKPVDIKIKNLPSSWIGKKAVQLSDIHLGSIYGKKFIEKIITETNKLQPDIIFITGDYFDGLDGNASELIAPLAKLQNKNGIFFIMGNHETYYGSDKIKAAFAETPIKILQDEKVEIDGLQIIGDNYRGPEVATKIETVLNLVDPTKPSIMLSHVPINIEKIKNSGVDLLLCGHTHNGQLWPFNFITNLIFKGFDSGLRQTGNLSVYTTNGLGTWGPPIRTSSRPEIVLFTLN